MVMSHYPPIDLYDDVADPRDWEALARAQHDAGRYEEAVATFEELLRAAGGAGGSGRVRAVRRRR